LAFLAAAVFETAGGRCDLFDLDESLESLESLALPSWDV
jgi:hypothetical protein